MNKECDICRHVCGTQDRIRENEILALREDIANAARDHGSACGELGHADTTRHWLTFRRKLCELARMAGAPACGKCCA